MNRKHRKHFSLAVLCLPACLCGTAQAQPAADGRIFLQHLPNEAHVYVDRKPARLLNGDLILAAGRHMVQIEARPDGKLQAMRLPVELRPGERQLLTVRLRPVRLPNPEYKTWTYPVPGASGPQGEPGPAPDSKPVDYPLRTQRLWPRSSKTPDSRRNGSIS